MAMKYRPSISLLQLLVLFVGGSVLLSAGSVLWLSWSSSNQSIRNVMLQRGNLLSEQVERLVINYMSLGPKVADAVLQGLSTIDPEDLQAKELVLKTAISLSPDVRRVIVVTPDQKVFMVMRNGQGSLKFRTVPRFWKSGDKLKKGTDFWGFPDSRQQIARRILVFHRWSAPVSNDRILVLVNLDADNLSQVIKESGSSAGTPFVLWRRDHVVAHPLLSEKKEFKNIYELATFKDEVLQKIWQTESIVHRNPGGLGGHISRGSDGGQRTLFLFEDMGPTHGFPIIVGLHIPAAEFGSTLRQQQTAFFIAGGLLVLTILLAAYLARLVTRPINRLARAANALRSFDLDAFPKLPPSRIRDIEEARTAFNAARTGLSAFSRFVPRALVLRLLEQASDGDIGTELRDVTILFTDIVGYTNRTHAMGAEETARFLNEHFELITDIVEAEGGTVDKFIGDSVMAFWGAPEHQNDHRERAARAAIKIAEAIATRNSKLSDNLRLRIGLSSGEVVVGTIGSSARRNYTVIGEPVNVAARLEQLGKSIAPDDEVVILTGSDFVKSLPVNIKTRTSGHHKLRGLSGELEVFRLVSEGNVSAEDVTEGVHVH